MPENWKILQDIYQTTEVKDDLLIDKEIVLEHLSDHQLIERIIEYFENDVTALYYPSKSYAVAIIYAKLLEVHFQTPFYENLNHTNLLANNDKYFIPYSEAQHVYDEVLKRISLDFDESLSQVRATTEYFMREFYISEELYYLINT